MLPSRDSGCKGTKKTGYVKGKAEKLYVWWCYLTFFSRKTNKISQKLA